MKKDLYIYRYPFSGFMPKCSAGKWITVFLIPELAFLFPNRFMDLDSDGDFDFGWKYKPSSTLPAK